MLISVVSALVATTCPAGHPLRLDVKSFTTVEVVLTPTIDREVTLTLEDPKRPVRVLRWAPGPGVARQRVVHLPEGCWLVSPLVVDGEEEWKSEPPSATTWAALTLTEPKLRIAFTKATSAKSSLEALGTPLTGGARLKGGEPIGELLGIVTEIALEKANAAATRILRQTLARLCDEIMDD